MSAQPKALQLADVLAAFDRSWAADAAAELRRLAAVEQERDRLLAVNAQMLAALERIFAASNVSWTRREAREAIAAAQARGSTS